MTVGTPASLFRAFRRDLRLAPATSAQPVRPVDLEDLADLPDTVQRYFAAMGVIGQPAVRSFAVAFAGRFRLGPDKPWLPMRSLQYNVARPVTRIYTLRVLFGGVLPMVGHDTYVDGRGRMTGRMAGILPVVDGSGDPFDVGELVTYVNDAVVLAPAMLLGGARFAPVDDRSFEVSLSDHGRTVTGRVLLDDQGLPRDFRTTDRYYDAPDGPVRCEWRTPIDSWDRSGAGPFPGPARATWHLPGGERFTYVEGAFVPGSLRTNVVPKAL